MNVLQGFLLEKVVGLSQVNILDLLLLVLSGVLGLLLEVGLGLLLMLVIVYWLVLVIHVLIFKFGVTGLL